MTGVRWAESVNRAKNQGMVTIMKKKNINANEFVESGFFAATPRGGVVLVNDNTDSRRMIEHCYRHSTVVINPIIEWADRDIWEFIREENLPYCSLYDDGWSRLGCIGCPMAMTTGRNKEFARWPKYKKAYLRAFRRMLDLRKEDGLPTPIDDENDYFHWWMEDGVIPGQMSLFDDFEEE